ncbi:MAG TPA: sigma-70 family RNA polymerase sigma factor [Pirellulales bacterium]
MSLDQNDLAYRLLAGDETVLHDLETDVWPGVSRRILRRFPGLILSADLPDLLQETRLAFLGSRARYNTSKGAVPSWFAGIAFNKAKELAKRERLRRHRREWDIDLLEARLGAPAEAGDDEDGGDERDDGDGDTGIKLRRKCRRLAIARECLAAMSDRRRELLFARYGCAGEPPTSRELADWFAMTPAAVRQELHRAAAEIREYFAKAKAERRYDDNAAGGGPEVFSRFCHTRHNIVYRSTQTCVQSDQTYRKMMLCGAFGKLRSYGHLSVISSIERNVIMRYRLLSLAAMAALGLFIYAGRADSGGAITIVSAGEACEVFGGQSQTGKCPAIQYVGPGCQGGEDGGAVCNPQGSIYNTLLPSGGKNNYKPTPDTVGCVSQGVGGGMCGTWDNLPRCASGQ